MKTLLFYVKPRVSNWTTKTHPTFCLLHNTGNSRFHVIKKVGRMQGWESCGFWERTHQLGTLTNYPFHLFPTAPSSYIEGEWDCFVSRTSTILIDLPPQRPFLPYNCKTKCLPPQAKPKLTCLMELGTNLIPSTLFSLFCHDVLVLSGYFAHDLPHLLQLGSVLWIEVLDRLKRLIGYH